MTTTTQQLRHSIFDLVQKVEDRNLLNSLHDLLKSIVHFHQEPSGKVVGYTLDGKEITAEMLADLVVKRSASMQAGNYLTHEEMLAKFESYRKSKEKEAVQ